MDMFYAACEELNDPTLKTIPFAVGSNMMLSTSNYIARKYGVRAGKGYNGRSKANRLKFKVWTWQGPKIPEKGQPGFIGKKLCSELGNVQLKIVPTNYELYKEIGTVWKSRFGWSLDGSRSRLSSGRIFKLRKAAQVRSVLRQYSKDFDPLGLDESFLDMTEHMVLSKVLKLMIAL